MTIPLIDRAARFTDRTAVLSGNGGERQTYGQLLAASARAASALLDGRADLREAAVAFLTPPSFDYVATQWAIWRAGGMATPLCALHPEPELDYVIADSGAQIVVAHRQFADRLRPIAARRGLRFCLTDDLVDLDATDVDAALPGVDPARRAMLLYTSGTTSRPKGAVTTHANIAAQVAALVEAWEWTADDHILVGLPLHHIHGIINNVCCALWSGATCELLPQFDADAVWDRIVAADGLTLFMAVPTVYTRLTRAWQDADEPARRAMTRACAKLRLMVCGSAALPVPTLEQWRAISGHTLLERYGMTEIGMALSNPLHGERRPGCVGSPLPRVIVRLVDDDGHEVGDGHPGQIQVKGPAVFKEYLGKPQATADAFTYDGWFKTGDVAVREGGVYRILGRESVDIIKTGGYKVSALEIEDALRAHEAIAECAVVGLSDEEWGQRVAVAVVCNDGVSLDLDALRAWAKQRLAAYKVPTRLLVVPQLPRNALGKVTKPAVVELFAGAASESAAT